MYCLVLPYTLTIIIAAMAASITIMKAMRPMEGLQLGLGVVRWLGFHLYACTGPKKTGLSFLRQKWIVIFCNVCRTFCICIPFQNTFVRGTPIEGRL